MTDTPITEAEFEEFRTWIAGLIPEDGFAFGEQLAWSIGWKRLHRAVFHPGAGTGSDTSRRWMDAFDFSEGLWLGGGDSTDPDGTWLDFIAHDEDEE